MTATRRRPLIGVTTSEMREAVRSAPLAEADPPQREMALGMVYLLAIERAGGLPVVLPPLPGNAIGPLLDRLDGLCLSGGPDLDPTAYDAPPHRLLGEIEPDLDAFELALAAEADAREMPVLGICRGAQALNVARGGTLHQHVADVVGDTIAHRQHESGRHPTHLVVVEPDTRLSGIVGAGELAVNSFHHQAVHRLGRDLHPVAHATDGLIEAIEADGDVLCLGVQWHAEGLVDDARHCALFAELVDAAASRRDAVEGSTWL
ncbi:MAG TPA: gamma-glutamyl-gamma-aminobutyrate hydrolase family protein [Baekduia sp.]|nr:gamma-glutamyl-gamma-aminobutyrate hydrolase family protein [Baekduia sp.]